MNPAARSRMDAVCLGGRRTGQASWGHSLRPAGNCATGPNSLGVSRVPAPVAGFPLSASGLFFARRPIGAHKKGEVLHG